MHSWNSEASPNRSSYSNWWLYKMFVNLSQPSYLRGERENEKKCSGHRHTHTHFEVGAGWCAATVFFRQADLWVGSTVTLKWCDEWYDLLLLMYSRSVEKKLLIRQSCVHQCKLLNITVTAISSTLRSGWKELWKQGRMTGRTWVHAPTIAVHCP